MRIHSLTSIILLSTIISACSGGAPSSEDIVIPKADPAAVIARSSAPAPEKPQTKRIDFSGFSAFFPFSAEIPQNWEAEFLREGSSVNLYIAGPARSNLEKSQIFLRFFQGNDFLTLPTVDIRFREEFTLNGHPAVRYEIEKKATAPDFENQPPWRNEPHEVVDVRYTGLRPDLFVVIARRPSVPQETFEKFLLSIQFHNEPASFVAPLSRSSERVTKKPFGIRIDPATSPVQPERFSGFHTGADYETFAFEQGTDVSVHALCGGVLKSAKSVDGYGGVAVQECMRGDEVLTVVYGHLSIPSIVPGIGEYLSPGEKIGLLGEQGNDTDGERKHLHLGIHRGREIELAGYVQTKEELEEWMDPSALSKGCWREVCR